MWLLSTVGGAEAPATDADAWEKLFADAFLEKTRRPPRSAEESSWSVHERLSARAGRLHQRDLRDLQRLTSDGRGVPLVGRQADGS